MRVLEELRIRNLGVIEDALLELRPGLTGVTGETGTGKTMVLTGLALLCGGRADSAAVRAGCQRAQVEGRLRLDHDHPSVVLAREAGAELDSDGTLLVARTVTADGRSRAYLGGVSVPNSVLARVMDDVVAVHGQNTQVGLLRPAAQRAALDAYAGVARPDGSGLLDGYRREFEAWRAADAELAVRAANARERAQEADMLRRGLDEIESVSPQPDEESTLGAEAQVLAHADALRAAAEQARTLLTGDEASVGLGPEDVFTQLVAAQRALSAASDNDPVLARLAGRLREVSELTSDLASDLASYAAGIETDPGRLAEVESRRSALSHLTRRYGATVRDVLQWSEHARGRLAELDDSEEVLSDLAARRDTHAARTSELAAELRRVRSEAAVRLQDAVAAQLAGLELGDAGFAVSVVPIEGRASAPDGTRRGPTLVVDGAPATVGPDGAEQVVFELASGSHGASRPLAKVASGGELSRIMLAVEVALAQVTRTPVLVFDEADAGIGGRTAVEVGRRMGQLGRLHQVFAVTHLAQVAAFADTHLVVRKVATGRVTRSDVRSVVESDRTQELARMLSGLEESGSGLAHAEELLAAAGNGREAWHA